MMYSMLLLFVCVHDDDLITETDFCHCSQDAQIP